VRKVGIWALRVLAGALVLATALSIIESPLWWIRIWDFPRLQILAVLMVAMILSSIFDREWRRWLIPLILFSTGWQLFRIFPYTPLARAEVAFSEADARTAKRCFSVLSFNVLQFNRDYAPTLAMLKRVDPDILLLLETDRKWEAALMPMLARYPARLSQPLDNTYGLIFATRLLVSDGHIENIAEPATPSVHARLSIEGVAFKLMGLHPRPPRPGDDTEERDAEIAIAATRAAREKLPVLAIGDFNDVAWSHTSHLFKRIGGYLDPRIGRGTYATFPAAYPLLAWPLDHLFFTPEFTIRKIAVLPYVGSDHRPVYAELCLAPGAAKRRNDTPAAADSEDKADKAEIIEEYRQSGGD